MVPERIRLESRADIARIGKNKKHVNFVPFWQYNVLFISWAIRSVEIMILYVFT